MRILSKFKDYYDTAVIDPQIDSTTLYLREESAGIDIRPNFLPSKHYTSRTLVLSVPYERFPIHNDIKIDVIPIGFCGKIYFSFHHEGTYAAANIESMVKLILVNADKKVRTALVAGMKKLVKDCQASMAVITESLLGGQYFDLFTVPYYVVRAQKGEARWAPNKVMLISNYNNLQQLKFTSIFTACQAYQEIEMYLNSILTKPDNAAQITDSNVLLAKKGFDCKTSFRHPIKL